MAAAAEDAVDEAVHALEAGEVALVALRVPVEEAAGLEEQAGEELAPAPVSVEEGERAEARADADRPALDPAGELAREAGVGGERPVPVVRVDEQGSAWPEPGTAPVVGRVEHDQPHATARATSAATSGRVRGSIVCGSGASR